METFFKHFSSLSITQLAIVNDRFVAVGDIEGHVYIIDTCTKLFTQKERVNWNEIVHLCFSPNGRSFISADKHYLCVVETKSGHLLHLLPYQQEVKPVWLNDQTIIYFGETYLTAFNIQTKEKSFYFRASVREAVIGVSCTQHAIFSPSVIEIVDSATRDRTNIVRYNTRRCESIEFLGEKQFQHCESIEFLDEKQLAIIFCDRLCVADIASGEIVRTFPFDAATPEDTFRISYSFDISFDRSCLLINNIFIPFGFSNETVYTVLIFDIVSGKLIFDEKFTSTSRKYHNVVKFSRKGDKIFGIYGHLLQCMPTPPTALLEMEEKTKEIQRSGLVL